MEWHILQRVKDNYMYFFLSLNSWFSSFHSPSATIIGMNQHTQLCFFFKEPGGQSKCILNKCSLYHVALTPLLVCYHVRWYRGMTFGTPAPVSCAWHSCFPGSVKHVWHSEGSSCQDDMITGVCNSAVDNWIETERILKKFPTRTMGKD